jgi:LysM repeat protein
MQHRRLLTIGWIGLMLSACGTTVAQRPTPNPIINITPAPTINIEATKAAFDAALQPTTQAPGLYLVREGDTLESIALAFNTSIDAITMTNRISDANVIYIGQPLIIPSLISTTNVLSPSSDYLPGEATPTP